MIHPVILCGGSGTRLWPLSRPEQPKPFLPLLGERTLFQQALARISEQAYAVPMFTLPIYYVGAEGLTYQTYPDEILRFWEYSWQ